MHFYGCVNKHYQINSIRVLDMFLLPVVEIHLRTRFRKIVFHKSERSILKLKLVINKWMIILQFSKIY